MANGLLNLGRFKVGQQPIITATFTDVTAGGGISTAALFTVLNPDGTRDTYTEVDGEVAAGGDNIWSLTMPVITLEGDYWVRGQSTAGLVGSNEGLLQVGNSPLT